MQVEAVSNSLKHPKAATDQAMEDESFKDHVYLTQQYI
jgi:hypothetical protein